MSIPGLPLDAGIGSLHWFRETASTMNRFPRSVVVGGFQHVVPRFLVLEHAAFDALFASVRRGWRVRLQLEANVPEGATPFLPLAADAPFWQSVNALSAHLGGPSLPLPDGPSGTLESGRPYVASAEATWTHEGIEASVRTNRLEHVAVFHILGPDPGARPRTRTSARRKKT